MIHSVSCCLEPICVPTEMQSDLFVLGMLYLFLTVVGVLGNAAVILAFLLLLYQEKRLLPADAIVLHLACVNLLVVGIRCLLETLASFHLAAVFSDVGCKSVIFVYRRRPAPCPFGSPSSSVPTSA